jgi:hypothetical protein
MSLSNVGTRITHRYWNIGLHAAVIAQTWQKCGTEFDETQQKGLKDF